MAENFIIEFSIALFKGKIKISFWLVVCHISKHKLLVIQQAILKAF